MRVLRVSAPLPVSARTADASQSPHATPRPSSPRRPGLLDQHANHRIVVDQRSCASFGANISSLCSSSLCADYFPGRSDSNNRNFCATLCAASNCVDQNGTLYVAVWNTGQGAPVFNYSLSATCSAALPCPAAVPGLGPCAGRGQCVGNTTTASTMPSCLCTQPPVTGDAPSVYAGEGCEAQLPLLAPGQSTGVVSLPAKTWVYYAIQSPVGSPGVRQAILTGVVGGPILYLQPAAANITGRLPYGCVSPRFPPLSPSEAR